MRINGAAVNPKTRHSLRKGDTVLLKTPEGGGYGEPALRGAAAVEKDRELGYARPE